MLTGSKMGPDQFAAECRKITTELRGHAAHRALDILTNRLLNSLGYGEGIEIFEDAIRGWHVDAAPYPVPPKPTLLCRLGWHKAVGNGADEYSWGLGSTCLRCGKILSGGNPCP